MEEQTQSSWGRVAPDGTVWLRTAEGEREIGSYPDATPEEALAYFARKYDELTAQVDLLEQRIGAGQLYGTAAIRSIEKLSANIPQARVLGDLDALTARLAALVPQAEERQAQIDAAKVKERAEALAQREALVVEAEQIASVDAERISWKPAGDRLRELFEEWKTQQRQAHLDRQHEDELWKRFSHARGTFDRKRRQHFGSLDERRAEAVAAKEKLVGEAEVLSTSTDWQAGARGYRDLMARWKATERAGRRDEERLWARFRAAQDVFFAARNAASAQVDTEQQANLEVKLGLLTEAEALLPVRDLATAKSSLRAIQERWETAGKVPASEVGRVEARMRAVEQAVRGAEDARWKRTNPEGLARAQAAVTQLRATLAQLDAERIAAEAAGNTRKVTEAEAAIAARQEWLTQAEKALAEFGGSVD